MENPINGNVFDSRDLIEYLEFLGTELVDEYNNIVINNDSEGEYDEVDEVEEIDFDNPDFAVLMGVEIDHFSEVKDFVGKLEGYGDFSSGVSIIHEDYFTEYCAESCYLVGDLSRDLPYHIESNINWDGVAQDLMGDYTEYDYNGDSFYMRS